MTQEENVPRFLISDETIAARGGLKKLYDLFVASHRDAHPISFIRTLPSPADSSLLPSIRPLPEGSSIPLIVLPKDDSGQSRLPATPSLPPSSVPPPSMPRNFVPPPPSAVFGRDALAPAPPLPPAIMQDEPLANMLLGWYYNGYYTGYWVGKKDTPGDQSGDGDCDGKTRMDED